MESLGPSGIASLVEKDRGWPGVSSLSAVGRRRLGQGGSGGLPFTTKYRVLRHEPPSTTLPTHHQPSTGRKHGIAHPPSVPHSPGAFLNHVTDVHAACPHLLQDRSAPWVL